MIKRESRGQQGNVQNIKSNVPNSIGYNPEIRIKLKQISFL